MQFSSHFECCAPHAVGHVAICSATHASFCNPHAGATMASVCDDLASKQNYQKTDGVIHTVPGALTQHTKIKNSSRQEIQCLRANRTTYAQVEASAKVSCTLGYCTCLLYFLRLFESPYGCAFLKGSHRHHDHRRVKLTQVCVTILNMSVCVSSKDCHLHQYILGFA